MRHFPKVMLLFLGLILTFNIACKKASKSMSADPMTRLDLFATHLPNTAEALVVIPQIEEFRNKANVLKKSVGESSVTGVVDGIQKRFQKSFGIDFLDAKSWKNAGLTPKSSLAVAIYRDRPLVYMFVDNRQKFEQTIIKAMENAFQFKGVVKKTKVGNYDVKILSDDPVKQIAWLYDEKMVMIAMPSLSTTGALEAGTASLVLTTARGVKADTSFKTLKSFTKFKSKYLPKYPIAALVPVENYLKNPDVQKRISEQQNGKEAEALMRQYLEYFVAVADFKGNRLSTEVFVGGNDKFSGVVKALSKMDVSGNWDAFTTENLGLGIRLSADPEGTLAFMKTAMSEKDVRRMERKFKRAGEAYGIDIEKDFLAASTGQLGIFFYGIAGNALALASGDINTILNKTGLMVALQFKSQKALETLIQKLVQQSEGKISIADAKTTAGQPLEGLRSITSSELPFPIRMLIYKDRFVVATPALGEEAILGYLNGTRNKDKRIKDVEGFDLGNEFASTKSFNGIYANFHRLKKNPGQILSMVGMGFLIESFEEIQFQISPDDAGIKVSLLADLNKTIGSNPKDKKNQKPAPPVIKDTKPQPKPVHKPSPKK